MPVLDQLLLVIERDWWQDAALSAGNIFFSVTLIPMLRHPGKPPLLTCIPTALGWLGGGIVFASLHLWVAALTQMIVGVQWLALAFKKPLQPAPGFSTDQSPCELSGRCRRFCEAPGSIHVTSFRWLRAGLGLG